MSPSSDQAEFISTLVPPDPNWGGMGATMLSLDPRDYDIRSLAGVKRAVAVGIPNQVDLTNLIRGPVLDQGASGACVAFSTAHLGSIDDVIEAGQWPSVDAVTMYRRAGGTGANGVDSRLVLQQAVDTGMPIAGGGAIKVIKSYAFVPQQMGVFTQTIKEALAAGYPVVLALLLPTDFGWRSGQGAPTSGYHQICGCGFTSDGYLIFLNSWGSAWFPSGSPKAGVGSVSFAYLEANGLQHNYVFAYTALASEIPDPTPIPPPVPVPPVPTPPPDSLSLSGKAMGSGLNTLTQGTVLTASTATYQGTVTITQIDGIPQPPIPTPIPPVPTPGTLHVGVQSGPHRILAATIQDDQGKYLEGTCTAIVAGTSLGSRPTHPQGGTAVPAVWVSTGFPAGSQATVSAVTSDGRQGSGTGVTS